MHSVQDATSSVPVAGDTAPNQAPGHPFAGTQELVVRMWGRVEFWVVSRVAVIGSILLIGSIVNGVARPWWAGGRADRRGRPGSEPADRVHGGGLQRGPVRRPGARGLVASSKRPVV